MRGLVFAIPAALMGAVGFVAGWLAHGREPEDPRTQQINEHARLLAKASKAYRKGNIGEANIYAEAAEQIIQHQPMSRSFNTNPRKSGGINESR